MNPLNDKFERELIYHESFFFETCLSPVRWETRMVINLWDLLVHPSEIEETAWVFQRDVHH